MYFKFASKHIFQISQVGLKHLYCTSGETFPLTLQRLNFQFASAALIMAAGNSALHI